LKQELHILLIDDNPDHVKIVVWALEQSEIASKITVIDDGKSAIEALDLIHSPMSAIKRPPDLVFLDINLPNVNGIEVLQHIRKNPGLQSLPVVVLSSSDRIEDVHAAYRNGANTFISKASIFNEVAHAINSVCVYWARIALLPTQTQG
jgi:CheY-like chemotaxis protein